MERLTARTEKGLAYLVNVKPDEQVVESPYKNTLQCILDCFDRLAAYEDTGKTPEQIAERTKAQQELKDMLDDLISVGNKDSAETYTTGYRNGYRNGRIELLKYILQIPDGTCEAAEEETPSDWTKNKACRDAVLKTFGGES